jgi:hypothetical protein
MGEKGWSGIEEALSNLRYVVPHHIPLGICRSSDALASHCTVLKVVLGFSLFQKAITFELLQAFRVAVWTTAETAHANCWHSSN